MTTLISIAAVVVVLIVALLLIASRRPDQFSISRSTHIAATPETIFNFIGNFSNFEKWSPWAELDPDMTLSLSGAPDQIGTIYEWQGNRSVGAGRQEIIEKVPFETIRVKIEFFRPMKTANDIEYRLISKGNGTEITWTMSGPSPFMSRVFSLFFDMDKLVGKDFEKGLSKLKALCEAM